MVFGGFLFVCFLEGCFTGVLGNFVVCWFGDFFFSFSPGAGNNSSDTKFRFLVSLPVLHMLTKKVFKIQNTFLCSFTQSA